MSTQHRPARLALVVALACLLSTLPLHAAPPDPTSMRLIAGADVAVCHTPDDRGSVYVKLNGHEFDVHRASVVFDPKDRRKVVSISGQISHKLAFRPDDEIHYHITYPDGKTKQDVEIDHGGFGELAGLPFEILSGGKVSLPGVGEITITPKGLVTVATYLSNHIEGRGWQYQAGALVDQIAAVGLVSAEYCGAQHWTEWTSNNRPAVQCPAGMAGAGYACSGSYCSLNKLECEPVPAGVVIDDRKPYWLPEFSEEGASAKPRKDQQFCDAGVVVGISATGKYSDNISLECKNVQHGKLDNCVWSEWKSEHDGGFQDFGLGQAIIGARCQGSYCSSMQFLVCDLHP
jgi:hypothetical protein